MTDDKILLARSSPQKGCFADDGEVLVVAPIGSIPKKPGPHYFVGLSTGKRSKFAWVKSVDGNAASWASFGENLIGDARKEAYDSLSRLKEGDAVAVDFVPRGIPPHMELLLHKVIFHR